MLLTQREHLVTASITDHVSLSAVMALCLRIALFRTNIHSPQTCLTALHNSIASWQQGLAPETHHSRGPLRFLCGVNCALQLQRLNFTWYLTVMNWSPCFCIEANTYWLANSSVIQTSEWKKRHPNICWQQTNSEVFIFFWYRGAECVRFSRLSPVETLTRSIL